MAIEQFEELALVLRVHAFQERDRIVTLLTEHHGKINVLARGAVSSKRFGGALDVFAVSKIDVRKKNHAQLGHIQSARLHHELRGLSGNLEVFYAASFILEFCYRILEEQAPARDLFVQACQALVSLSEVAGGKIPFEGDDALVAKILTLFMWRALVILGVQPNLTHCLSCKLSLDYDFEFVRWSPTQSGLHCSNCQVLGPSILVEGKSLRNFLLEHALSWSALRQQWATTRPAAIWPRKEWLFLLNLLVEYLKLHLNQYPKKGFESLKLFNSVL